MYLLAQDMLPVAGYVFIGLDHFAKPEERLAVAMREGTLQRNFQGMTTGRGLDLIGFGASSISQLTHIGYLQNRRDVDEYIRVMQSGESPAYRGKRFTGDDLARQAVIGEIYCGPRFALQTSRHRRALCCRLFRPRDRDPRRAGGGRAGRTAAGRRLPLTDPLGRVLMRTVGAVFDSYLPPDAYRVGDRQYFSATA